MLTIATLYLPVQLYLSLSEITFCFRAIIKEKHLLTDLCNLNDFLSLLLPEKYQLITVQKNYSFTRFKV